MLSLKPCPKINRLASGTLLLLLAVNSSTPASSAPIASEMKQGVRPTSSRLEIPKDFNEETVRALIDTIEEPRKAAILEIGYFYGRGKPSFSVAQGYSVLKSALEKETVGSRRWFILQEVRAWAALRNREISSQESLDAYDAIFEQAAMAKPAKASFALNKAINDFVFNVQGRLEDLHLSQGERVQGLLLRAWETYYSYPSSSLGTREPLWEEAIVKADLRLQFIPSAEKVLNDPAVPKTYNLLTTISSIFLYYDKERAIPILRQAKNLLPDKNQSEARRFYKMLVDVLSEPDSRLGEPTNKERMLEAVSLQQELVKLTGYGQSELLILHARNGNVRGFDAALNEIAASSDVSDEEVNNAVKLMKLLSQKDKDRYKYLNDKVILLLDKYLRAERKRVAAEELKARISLAQEYISMKKNEEAKSVLAIQPIELPQSSMLVRQLKEKIVLLQNRLQTK